MRPQKPTRLDKVLAWRQTYYEVLEELTEGMIAPPDLAILRAAAARTAAVLIQGVVDGNSDSGNR